MVNLPSWRSSSQELERLVVVKLNSFALVHAKDLDAELLKGVDQFVLHLNRDAGGWRHPKRVGGEHRCFIFDERDQVGPT